ncbi:MAG TPA: hypothetical protein VEB42_16975 [Chitinophagaceae bacterium]|nr:hypothetical protein [Chitinophagaceae bacterium]
MDKELREYFLRILYSLTAFVVWLVINMTGGIYLGWLFFENNMKAGNIVFYSFMVLSFAWLMWYLIKLWKGKVLPKP